ncbi:MAG: ubiquinone/menaquinone biosynthesis C-methylase UbiE [Paraglaciecola psychrophila]
MGFGCCDTTLALAQTGAKVIGVDISAPMLAKANHRKDSLANTTVQFLPA